MDPTHVDYVPTLFSFTTEEQKAALRKRVKKHEQIIAMKKRRLECGRRKETDVSCAGANVPLVASTTVEITGETETEELSINIVDDHSGNENDEISNGPLVVQDIEQITGRLADKEARCEELETVVLEFEGKMEDSEAKIKELHEKNVDLEAENAKLKETISRYESQLHGESHVEKASSDSDASHQQTAVKDAVVKEIQKTISTLESRCLTMESLKDNNKLVKFYTGLPNYDTLKVVFELASKCLLSTTEHGHRKLTNGDEFLLTMVKLRLNLRNADLGFRFGVAESTVSNIIHKWLNLLYVALKFLIRWPTREEVRATLPECFRSKFAKAVVIIDCTEIFIERATNLLARSQTWSNYKSHNTVKYLIGITPQGTVSFVSDAWGGRVSDKHITQECGILNSLLPGDLILADRGFNIYELVAMHQAEAKLPAFTKGKTQLIAKEVQESRELAVV